MTLAPFNQPYHRLKLLQSLQFKFEEGAGKFSHFEVDYISPTTVTFKSVAHIKETFYLSCKTPTDGLCSFNYSSIPFVFEFSKVCMSTSLQIDSSLLLAPKPSLSEMQLKQFHTQGFLQLKDIVPISLVNNALRLINNAIGSGNNFVPQALHTNGTASVKTATAGFKLAGSISNHNVIKSLFYDSDAFYLAESLIGRGCIQSVSGAQLALIFPSPHAEDEGALSGTDWHTDGMRQGHSCPFTLLLGIALSNVQTPLAGNFTVFPGSHLKLHELMLPGNRSVLIFFNRINSYMHIPS